MRPRRALVLAGGTVALVGIVHRRPGGSGRRSRPTRPAIAHPHLRVVPLLGLYGWGFPEAKADLSFVFFGLGSLIATGFGWVLSFVEAAVQGAIDELAGWVRVALDLGSQLLDNATDNLSRVTHTVEGLALGAYQTGLQLTTLVPDAFRSALEALPALIDKAIRDWLPDILRAVGGLGEDLVRSVLGNLWAALEWLGVAFPTLQAGWAVLYSILTDPIGTVWSWVWDNLIQSAGQLVLIGIDQINPGLAEALRTIGPFLVLLLKDFGDPQKMWADISKYIVHNLEHDITIQVSRNIQLWRKPLMDMVEDAFGLN